MFVFLVGEDVSVIFPDSWTNDIKFPHRLVASLDGRVDEALIRWWYMDP